MDDEALAASIVRSRRAPEDFADVVRALSSPLHGYLSRRAPRDADDLLAEAWLQAFRSRAGYDPGRGTARAWAFGVARHVLLAHLRLRPDVAAHLPEQASDPWPEVDDRLAASAAGPTLRAALAALPAVERELLLLVAWEGLSPTVAAAVVDVPAGTARTRLFRARTRLRESLDPGAVGVPIPEVTT
jgi:RNA polymerase sigma-70 factor (ECF subfamily)